MGPIRYSETSVKDYHTTLRNMLKERRPHKCFTSVVVQILVFWALAPCSFVAKPQPQFERIVLHYKKSSETSLPTYRSNARKITSHYSC
jgi:hypothetical protein